MRLRSIALAVCGVFVAFMVLEILLSLFGFLYKKNRVSSIGPSNKDGSLYKIVALGESTTAPFQGPAWPEFLEEELNKRVGTRRFRVYNLGVAGSNTSAIFQRLQKEAMPLNPHLVITMMGVNDIKYLALPVVEHTMVSKALNRIKTFRTTRLLVVLWQMIRSASDRQLVEKAVGCTDDEEIGNYDWTRNYVPRYQSFIDSIYPEGYSGQFSNGPIDHQAEEVVLDFLEIHPFSYQAYEVLVAHYALRSMWYDVLDWTKRAREIEPFIRLCIRMNSTITAHAKTNMLRHLTDIELLMESMHETAKKIMTNPGHSGLFYDQIRSALGTDQKHNINTERSYESLALYLRNHGVIHIAMQYPLLPMSELHEMIGDIAGVEFVSNDENFHSALRTYDYWELFTDNFGGVFGHTTPLGSQLIASAAAERVLQIVPPALNLR